MIVWCVRGGDEQELANLLKQCTDPTTGFINGITLIELLEWEAKKKDIEKKYDGYTNEEY